MSSWAYPAVIAAALLAGGVLLGRAQRELALGGSQRLGVAIGAFCGAMLGAKLPFVLSGEPGPLSAAAWISDGKTILAGLVGGYLGVELAKALLGVRVKTGDSFAVPAATAVGIGRLGCFVGGCCYGLPTNLPWAARFADGVPRHPAQLYESAFHLSFAAVLLRLREKGLLRRQLMKLYILGYLVYRFVSESWRPEPVFGLGLTAYQWAALALVPCFAWLWRRDAHA